MKRKEVRIYLLVDPDGQYVENDYGPKVFLEESDAFRARPSEEYRVEEYRLARYFDGFKSDGIWQDW